MSCVIFFYIIKFADSTTGTGGMAHNAAMYKLRFQMTQVLSKSHGAGLNLLCIAYKPKTI